MSGRVVFQADTSQFTAPVERSATTVRELSKALKEQERIARETYRDQIANAKASGAATSELEKLEQQRYRTLLALQAAQKQVNAESVSDGKAAVSSAEAQAEAVNLVTAAYEKQLIAVNATFGEIKRRHSEVTGSVATGAAVATLEGVKNVGAIEGLLAKTLGLGEIIQAAFPLVGAVAFGQILLEVGENLLKIREEATEMPEHIRGAFEGLNAPLYKSVDNLRETNDQLEIAIAKLEHKPVNTLALELDKARVNADQLAESMNRSAESVKKVLDANQVGFKQWLFSGQTPTGPFSDEIKKRVSELDELQRADRDAVRSGNDTPDAAKARTSNIEGRLRSLYEYAKKNKADLQSFDNGSQTSNINILTGVQDWAGSVLDERAEQRRNATLNRRKDQLTPASGASSSSPASTLRDKWDTSLKELQQFGSITATEERSFWSERVSAVKQGTDDYTYAYDRYLDASKKVYDSSRKQAEDLRKANEKQRADSLKQLQDAITPGAVAQSQGIADASSSGRSLADSKQSAGYTVAEANIRYREQIGLITQADAAIQLKNLHELQYSQQLAKLKEDLAAVQLGPDADAQRNRINQQIVDLNGRHIQQQYSDATATWDGSTSGAAGARNALSDFVRSTRDAATQMQRITASLLNGINDQLANAIVGDGTDWGSTFKGIGRQIAKSGLERAEGSLLGAFGLGKPDGSATNPLNVRIVAGFGDVGSLLGGDSDGKSGFMGIIASIFGGGKAVGGSVSAGTTYLIGEKGPELFTPGSTGAITPNDKLWSFGGGDNISYSIDARGTDPVQTDMRVRAAIVAAHQSSVKQAVKQVHQQSARQPRRR
jgi:hypothetical protein